MPPTGPHHTDEPTASLRSEASTTADPERTVGTEPAAAPVAALPPGYEYLGELGRGGMGVVYRARHVKLDRVCAVKMILAGGHAGPRERRRFEAEARAVARLQHPGIVQVFEVGEHDGVPFMALEYCPGGSLDRRLRDRPPTAREAAALVRDLAEAVQAAHAAGVIHRDLKPANVLLGDDARPKVTDFGLAKRLDEDGQTQTGAVVGTPAYMPPEQARGDKDLGPAVDVYALGATLYAALTGRPPFRGATVAETVHQVLTRDAVPVRALNPAVPKDLETIAHKCLQKDPAKRYASAAALADDLARFLDGRPVLARPVGAVERGWRWCRRNPAVASLTAAVALVLLAGIAVAAYFALRAEAKAELHRREVIVANRERRRAEGLLYAAELREALEYWDKGQLFEAEEVFHACQADLRGWEHDYVHTLWYRCQRTVLQRRAGLGVGAFSPDGQTFATTGPDYSIKLWDLRTGHQAGALLKGHTRPFGCIAYSPDGRRLVTATSATTKPGSSKPVGPAEIKVWDVAAGEAILTLAAHADVIRCAAFSPDGGRVVSASQDKTVRVWDVATGTEVLALTKLAGSALAATFSPDGSRLATAAGDDVQVWNVRTGREVALFGLDEESCACLAFSPDGKRLVGGCSDGVVRVWDPAGKQEVEALDGHAYGDVACVAFSRDGKRLVSGGNDQALKVWDLAVGGEVLTFRGHQEPAGAVAFSADGAHVLSASGDGTLRAWDAVAGQRPFLLLEEGDLVTGVAFSPDGRWLVSAGGGGDGPVKVWDAATGKQLRALARMVGEVTAVAVSPDGGRIATAGPDKTVRVWDAADGRELLVLTGHAAEVTCVCFSPDGRRIGSGDEAEFASGKTPTAGGEVKVWDAATGREIFSLRAHRKTVTAVAFSPDGERLVSAGEDHTARVWDAASGEAVLVLEGHAERVLAAAWSPDGRRIATGSHDKTGRVWDAATGEVIHILRKHSDRVAAIAFSPDGQRIVTGSYDHTARIWDAGLGHLTLTLKGHSDYVRAVAWSPDGKRIATGSEDVTVNIWEATLPSPRTATPPTTRVPSYVQIQGGGY